MPYYRLKLDLFLDSKTSKCLYLDSDMLCLCDIRELFAIDLKDKIAGIAGDCGSKKRKLKFINALGKKEMLAFDKNYFNSGFLLINTQNYKKYHIAEKCEELAQKCFYITAADQDLLNAFITKKYQFKLPFAYNFVTHAFCYVICKDENKNRLNYTKEEFVKSAKEPKILHFGYKPWKFLRSFSDLSGKDVGEYWWGYGFANTCF